MSRSALLFTVTAFLFGGLSLTAFLGSVISYEEVLSYLNSIAPDGDVESYSSLRHELFHIRLRYASAGFGLIAMGMAFVSSHIKPKQGHPRSSSVQFFMDMREAIWRWYRGTAAWVKICIAVLCCGAALLRGMMLLEPITYDEAFTWTYYASRPLHVALADYSYPNNHILHTLFVKGSTVLFGVSLVPLRLPAFVASLVALPLFYLFVRSTFGRHVALLSLTLVVADGSLVEYSALARGYSITWLCMITAFMLMRYFLRTANLFSACMIGTVCGLGMWSVPTMLYPALLVHLWAFLLILFKGVDRVEHQIQRLLLSFLVLVAIALLLYSPVLVLYGPGQITAHPELIPPSWATMSAELGTTVMGTWEHFTDPVPVILVFAGILACCWAVYASMNFRLLAVALVLATVPVVLLQRAVAPARAWLFILFIMHIGGAIGLLHFLKALSGALSFRYGLAPWVIAAAFLVFAAFARSGMPAIVDRQLRFSEAATIANWLHQRLRPGDRVYTMFPWDAPVEFHAVGIGTERTYYHLPPSAGRQIFFLEVPDQGIAVSKMLDHHKVDPIGGGGLVFMEGIGRTKIFMAQFGDVHSR